MAELQYNNQVGYIGATLDAPAAGTSEAIPHLFATPPNFATLGSGNYIKLVLDANTSSFEIVYLTGYTAGSVGGVITRGAEDATNWPPVAHLSGVSIWGNNPTVADFVPWNVDPQSNNNVTRVRSSTGNFLSNGAFGVWFNGASVAPNGWTLDGDASITRSTTTTIGQFSAQVTFNTANTGELFQDANISTLVNYTYSCYVQLISGTGNARLVAQEEGGSFTEFASVNLSHTAGWQLAMLSVQPSIGTQMRFSIKSGGTTPSTWLVSECMYQESEAIATPFQYAFIDDTNTQTVYGNKSFGYIDTSQLQLNSGSSLYGGSGAPSTTLGVLGDYYFRDDTPGTTSQQIYAKTSASVWAAITSGGGGGGGSVSSVFTLTGAVVPSLGLPGQSLTTTGASVNWGSGTLSTQSGTSYTFVAGDAMSVVESTSTSATTFSIPTNASVPFPVGTQMIALQGGTGALTVASVSGVTLNGPTLTATSQWGTIVVQKIATDTWVGIASASGGITPTGAQTISNKRITKRVQSTSAPGATPSLNTDNFDVSNFTSLGTAITSMSTNLTGTPNSFDSLIIGFTDNGTARGITWGSSFEATTVALPTTTVISTLLLVGFLWNSTTSKWHCVGAV